ncbi:hypothetical protein HYV50_00230 [Candidatus Pacearchaeota archaeon]|nr:hypothetical protein [Candidatus Pacearchaeota archaeon]
MPKLFVKKLKKYSFILFPLSIGIMLPSLIAPWVTINLSGQHSHSPFDIIKSAISQSAGFVSQNQFDLLDLWAKYTDSYFALILSMITYITSITLMILSIALKKNRSKFILIAGILAMSSGISWIYTIESFKTHFVQTAVSAGGIIGEEWKGQESTIINSIIVTGFGHHLVILAGTLAILAYLWQY